MDIATVKKTVVTRSFVITLTEAELTQALIDSRPLQRELRKQRNAAGEQRDNWDTAGRAPRSKEPPKKKTGKVAKPVKAASADQKCPHCHYTFKRLAKHLPACPDRPIEVKPPSDE